MTKQKKKRYRDFGFSIGKYPPGKYNSITDVKGVMVGHSTIIKETEENKSIRTGVTAILPSKGNVFFDRLMGGGFILNGAGELSGLSQVLEWGIIETPILLTNTLSVGSCSQSMVRYLIEQYPGIGNEHDVIIPLVGECDDSWLNDVSEPSITYEIILEAIQNARSGRIEEGNVGGGTGMITCDLKGGIGTSSRILSPEQGGYTIGVLVMSNFGEMGNLRIDGFPIGVKLEKHLEAFPKRRTNYGSIIAVIGTDAPLLSYQLNRLSKRAALGIGRAGSYAAHGSGEIVLAFSTVNKIKRPEKNFINLYKSLNDNRLNPLYEAVIEAVEEAIINALFSAEDMTGRNGHFVPAIPVNFVNDELIKYYSIDSFSC